MRRCGGTRAIPDGNLGILKTVHGLGADRPIIFDHPPDERQPGDPPEWDEAVDRSGSFRHLHPWFATALAWEPRSRFSDAAAMLASLNEATASHPSLKAVLEGLERFRHWTTQRQIYFDLPSLKDIKSDDRVDIWLSKHEGRDVFVKMWKREAWGDRQSEAPRLLAFLEKAEALFRHGSIPIRPESIDAQSRSAFPNSSGNRAMLAAIRRASSAVSKFARLASTSVSRL
jgi:hypothetical protein